VLGRREEMGAAAREQGRRFATERHVAQVERLIAS